MRQGMESSRQQSGEKFRTLLLRLALFAGLLTACLVPSVAHGAGLSAPAYTLEEQRLLTAYREGTLIRLHILAEDDSPQAQELKLRVRDAVLEAFSGSLSSQDPQALYLLLQKNVEAMREVAEKSARERDFTGSVTAQVGVMTLPAKRYGQVLLPQGEYRALRITLGKGEGQNWWCVLFPSLCLAVADDEPWKTPAPEEESPGVAIGPSASQGEPVILWDSQRIMTQWLCLPGGF